MPPLPPADGPKIPLYGGKSAHRRRASDWVIAELAARQHGVVALSQFEALGLDVKVIDKRVAAGRMHRVHQGVYAIGHPLLTEDGRWMAGVLACGPDAVLSHRSAAALWRLRPDRRDRVDVTAPGRRGRSPVGIDAHRHGSLTFGDRTAVRGVPCTSVARTLLDLAALVPGYELRKAIGEAEVLRLFDRAAMGELLQRSRGRRGVATLRCAISELNPKLGFTRSQLERRFLGLCERAMLPLPIVNLPIGLAGGEVVGDFVWRDRRLIVEADGRRFHDTRVAFEADRRRDQRLTLAGWRVIRCTWRQVVDEPDDLVRVIRGLLASS